MHYPFHYSDSYLDEEINFLATFFDKLIVVSSNTYTLEKRAMPANAILYRFSAFEGFSRWKTLPLIFSQYFWKEVNLLRAKYKRAVNLTLIKELLLNLDRIKRTEKFIQNIWNQHQLDQSQVLVYTYWMLDACSACAFYKSNSKKKFTLISKAHSQDVYFLRNYYNYQPYKYQTFEISDKIFFISENALNYFASVHQLNEQEKKKIAINRVGVKGPENFIPSRNDGKLKVISIAWIHKLKRIELIADALAGLQDLEIEWIHLGASIDDQYSSQVMKRVEEQLGNKARVSYSFLGAADKSVLRDIFLKKNFDLIINVSETEGIPVSMMEAASFSVPLFGTNVGGVAEIIEDGVNGFLFNPNPEAKEITNLLFQFAQKSTAEKNMFRSNAFQTWKSKFNVDQNKVMLKEEINQLMTL